MTTIERYRPPALDIPSDATSSSRPPTSSSRTFARDIDRSIPPAVPTPPQRNSPPRKPHIPRPAPSANPYKMASEESSQWLFTEAEILSSPSIIDGLPVEEERCRRAKGYNFIMQAGMLLKLPQLTLAVASVFFHRFYMRRSMVPEKGGLHHYNIAATSLFLATKTEENCRKTKEIVIAVAKIAQKNPALIIDEQSKEYWKWRDNILLYEEMMLEVLTFDVVLKIPYHYLVDCLQELQLEDNKDVRNTSWAFINDSCMTTLCLLMPAKDIAIAAIYFAAKFNNETIPDDDNDNPWWEQLGGVPERMNKAVAVMAEFWSDNPLRKVDNPYGGYTSSGDDLDKTRRKGGSDGTSSVGAVSDTVSQNGVTMGEAGEIDAEAPASTKRDGPDGDADEGEVEELASKRAKTEDEDTKMIEN